LQAERQFRDRREHELRDELAPRPRSEHRSEDEPRDRR
jgi:hypothetical protein